MTRIFDVLVSEDPVS